jgi:dTMP kinase
MAGLFITFEGTEGSGKSTQIALTAEWLRSMGREVITLREPGGTKLGEEIRHLLKHSDAGQGMTPEAELFLMNASRAQLVREVIRPAVVAGAVVLCDRFYDSTVAYQGHGRGLDLESVTEVTRIAVGDCDPDLTLLLEVPVQLSEARRADRADRADGQSEAPDRFEQADREFFQRVEAGFRLIAAASPHRILPVDGSATSDAVQQMIRAAIQPRL